MQMRNIFGTWFCTFAHMGRPAITSGKRTERVVPVTFTTVEEKQAMQAHAKLRGTTLAGLLKMLLASDVAASSILRA